MGLHYQELQGKAFMDRNTMDPAERLARGMKSNNAIEAGGVIPKRAQLLCFTSAHIGPIYPQQTMCLPNHLYTNHISAINSPSPSCPSSHSNPIQQPSNRQINAQMMP